MKLVLDKKLYAIGCFNNIKLIPCKVELSDQYAQQETDIFEREGLAI
jgi:hypothetical protein